MKILHIINDLRIGGAEKLISEIIPMINNYEGIKCDLLILNNKHNDFYKELSNKNINIKILNYKNNYSLFNYFHILKEIKNYDIVHSHLFPSNYWVALSRVFYRKKILITTEHSTHNKRREKKWFRPIEQIIYKSYNKIISISDSTEFNLNEWLKNINKDKFITIDNGINFSLFNSALPYGKEIFFKKEDFLIAMVGSFTIQKDQETIIKSLKNCPEIIKLLLIGTGPREGEIKKLVFELDLENRVRFLGKRKDIPEILKTIDISIVSSNWEGFGLVAVEGMASGNPVIASNVDGLKQIVEGVGLIFQKGNYNELSKIINELFKNKVLYNQLKEKSIINAQKYDINIMVLKYIKLYKKLMFLSK